MRIVTIPPAVMVPTTRGADGGAASEAELTFVNFLSLLVDVNKEWGAGVKNRMRAEKLYRRIEAWTKEKPATIELEDYEWEKLVETDDGHNWGPKLGSKLLPLSAALKDALEKTGAPQG